MLEMSAAERKRLRIAFALSPALEIAGVVVLLLVAAVLPPAWPEPPVRSHYRVVNLLAPPPEPPLAVKPVITRVSRKRVRVETLKLPPVRVPRVEARRFILPPRVSQHLSMPKPVVTPQLAMVTPPRPLPRVHLGVLRNVSMAKPTVHLPAGKVQTGGFGSPEGITGQNLGGSKGNVVRFGAFNLPPGSGYGNGTGGEAGKRGVVASAGFGNGIVSARAGDTPAGGMVQSSGFGNAVAGAPTRRARLRKAKPDFEPAVILSKPNPIYPEDARRLHIEGNVLLDVVFQANGRVRVLRVVRGLGHGLDQAAINAAQHIVFKPARRDGQPVDSEAIARIVFRLAY
jgi:TonB family protein